MCDWDSSLHGWVLKTRVEGFETSGKVLFPVNQSFATCSSQGIFSNKVFNLIGDYQLKLEDMQGERSRVEISQCCYL